MLAPHGLLRIIGHQEISEKVHNSKTQTKHKLNKHRQMKKLMQKLISLLTAVAFMAGSLGFIGCGTGEDPNAAANEAKEPKIDPAEEAEDFEPEIDESKESGGLAPKDDDDDDDE